MAVPATAATVDSTVAIVVTCRGVAPTRRIAANRCSRRAAASRLAVPMKISTGKSSAPATTDRIRSMASASYPTTQPSHRLGEVVIRWSIRLAPGRCATCSGVPPMMMTSEFGAGSAAGPMTPTWWPGYRWASSAGGVVRSSSASAGDA